MLVHNSRANVPMKLNAQDDFFPNDKTFLTQSCNDNGLIK